MKMEQKEEKSMVDRITQTLMLTMFTQMFENVGGKFMDSFKSIEDTAFEFIWNPVVSFFKDRDYTSLSGNAMLFSFAFLVDLPGRAFNATKSVLKFAATTFTMIKKGVTPVFEYPAKWGKKIYGSVSSGVKTAWTTITTSQFFKTPVSAVKKIFTSFSSGISNTWNSLRNAKIFKKPVATIKSLLSSLLALPKKFFKSIQKVSFPKKPIDSLKFIFLFIISLPLKPLHFAKSIFQKRRRKIKRKILNEDTSEKVRKFIEDVHKKKKKKKSIKYEEDNYFFGKGLKNKGNLCYMNSGIQLIVNNPDILRALEKDAYAGKLEGHFLKLWRTGKEQGICDPVDIIQYYVDMKQFAIGQDDTARFLQGILRQFAEPVRSIIEWKKVSNFECRFSECKFKEENFYEPHVVGVKIVGYKTKLENSLEETFKLEAPCDKCESDTDCYVLETVKKIPKYCFFAIDRKDITGFPYKFPKEMILKNEVYELWGCAIRSGKENDSGHYYSYLRNEKTGAWWEFNDAFTREIDVEKVERFLGQEYHPREGGFEKLCQTHRIHVVVYRRGRIVPVPPRPKVTIPDDDIFTRKGFFGIFVRAFFFLKGLVLSILSLFLKCWGFVMTMAKKLGDSIAACWKGLSSFGCVKKLSAGVGWKGLNRRAGKSWKKLMKLSIVKKVTEFFVKCWKRLTGLCGSIWVKISRRKKVESE